MAKARLHTDIRMTTTTLTDAHQITRRPSTDDMWKSSTSTLAENQAYWRLRPQGAETNSAPDSGPPASPRCPEPAASTLPGGRQVATLACCPPLHMRAWPAAAILLDSQIAVRLHQGNSWLARRVGRYPAAFRSCEQTLVQAACADVSPSAAPADKNENKLHALSPRQRQVLRATMGANGRH